MMSSDVAGMGAGSASRTKSRITLLFVFGLFALPVVIAWLAFFAFPDWRPEGSTNHGELIQPPRNLQFSPLAAVEGGAVTESFLEGKWTYVLWADGACGDGCLEQLIRMHQVRLAQGKNIDRVQRLVLAQDMTASELRELQAHYPGMRIAHGNADEMRELARMFMVGGEEDMPAVGYLYLVDPMGNLMMRYAPGIEPRGIVKDLERLLRISYVG